MIEGQGRSQWDRTTLRPSVTPALRRGGSPRLGWSVDVLAIERQRILRGWTRRQLARQAHVNPDTLTDLFAGRRQPTFGTVQAVCASLGLALPNVIVIDALNSQGAFSETGGSC
jgi:hypothetical protein